MDYAEAFKWALGVLQLLVTAWCAHLYTEIGNLKKAKDELTKEVAAHQLRSAETYQTKTESTRAFDTLSRTLESLLTTMNNRFDRMDSKLDSKMDKGD